MKSKYIILMLNSHFFKDKVSFDEKDQLANDVYASSGRLL